MKKLGSVGSLAIALAMLCGGTRSSAQQSPCPDVLNDTFGSASGAGPHVEIRILFDSTSARHLPTFAVWAHAAGTDSVQTIYVTCKGAYDRWGRAVSRPSALPVWSGVRRDEGLATSGDEIDALTTATPRGRDFTIRWAVPPEFRGKQVDLYVEVNVSFDYNEHYTQDEAPNGQPSLVWRASFHAGDQPAANPIALLIGHGEVRGANATIDPDLSGITTARDLFRSVQVSYRPAGTAPPPRPPR